MGDRARSFAFKEPFILSTASGGSHTPTVAANVKSGAMVTSFAVKKNVKYDDRKIRRGRLVYGWSANLNFYLCS